MADLTKVVKVRLSEQAASDLERLAASTARRPAELARIAIVSYLADHAAAVEGATHGR